MLTIRLARTGKKKQAYFRLVVSDKRKTPTAKFVAILGNWDPHAKKLTVDKEKLETYLKNGAQPSNSVAKLLAAEKISLPKWVKITQKKKAAKKKEEPKEAVPKTEKAEETEEKPKEGSEKNEPKAEEAEAPKEESEPSENTNEENAAEKTAKEGE